MTVATMQRSALSITSSGCSSSEPLFSSFPSEGQHEFAISMPVGAVSFDWSDFPIVYQYNEDMPVPSHALSSAPDLQYSSTLLITKGGCSGACPAKVSPTLPWEGSDDDTTIFSVSSDEETLSACQLEETPKRNPNKKSVKFSEMLEIRSHALVLGDHPCSSGLALDLAWEPEEVEILNFDLFESTRKFQRRHMSALRLTYWERRRLLEKSTGLSEHELVLQEQRAWREERFPSHLSTDSSVNKDRAPTFAAQSCTLEAASAPANILRKVGSMESLAALTF